MGTFIKSHSRVPPSLLPTSIIGVIRTIYLSIGVEGTLSELARCLGSGKSSSLFRAKLSALRRYGTMVRSADNFEFTSLGIGMARPASKQEEARLLRSALLRIPTLRELFTHFAGIPNVSNERIREYLRKTFGYNEAEAKVWISFCRDALIAQGMIAHDDFVSFTAPIELSGELAAMAYENPQVIRRTTFYPTNRTPTEPEHEGLDLNVKLSDQRYLVIRHPEQLTAAEQEIIRASLKMVEAGLPAYGEPQNISPKFPSP